MEENKNVVNMGNLTDILEKFNKELDDKGLNVLEKQFVAQQLLNLINSKVSQERVNQNLAGIPGFGTALKLLRKTTGDDKNE